MSKEQCVREIDRSELRQVPRVAAADGQGGRAAAHGDRRARDRGGRAARVDGRGERGRRARGGLRVARCADAAARHGPRFGRPRRRGDDAVPHPRALRGRRRAHRPTRHHGGPPRERRRLRGRTEQARRDGPRRARPVDARHAATHRGAARDARGRPRGRAGEPRDADLQAARATPQGARPHGEPRARVPPLAARRARRREAPRRASRRAACHDRTTPKGVVVVVVVKDRHEEAPTRKRRRRQANMRRRRRRRRGLSPPERCSERGGVCVDRCMYI
mmetsp:Transcript_14198/g.56598  ORF Transcript_14198/g.56598 Transcript_14198/m.56598 type:complete len:276 (+) Transcript_14198:164-991(+)